MDRLRGWAGRWGKILLIALLVQTPLLLILDGLLDGFSVGGADGALALAFLASLLLTVTYPFSLRFSFRFRPLVFLIVNFVVTVLVFRLAIWIVESIGFADVVVNGFWTTVLLVICLLFAQSLAGTLLTSSDDLGYYAAIQTGLRFRHRHKQVSSTDPGVIFMEIDGLAKPIFEEAMANGFMPTLKRWLDSGTYQVSAWEPDLSSQTSASQAGILLGSNEEIPAFRWWNKETGQPEVSSSSDVASALELRLSTGTGLLEGGASRWNVFSGDAQDALATFSTVRGRNLHDTVGAMLFLSNPVTLSRSSGLFAAEVVRERWQARQQVRQDIQPRLHRKMKYALVRAATSTTMQEMNIFMLTSDMLAGLPVVYSTFFAYDEVAHHSGPRSSDAFKVLAKLDEGFAHLEDTAGQAARPYHLVVLSDHGQSAGATFLQRFGITLQQLVDDLIGTRGVVDSYVGQSESMGNVSATVDTVLESDTLATRLVRKQDPDGRFAFRGTASKGKRDVHLDSTGEHDIVVMASGNHGLISFPQIPGRVPMEAMESDLPGLLEGLAAHPGISFVMVHSQEHDEAVVIGPNGRYYLGSDRVEGEDPLAKFTSTAREHLVRTDGFSNAPDILVMSMYDPETGETAAFEELIGNHGGLGGLQQEPFVFHPKALPFPAQPVVGAGAVHRVLKSWVSSS